MRIKLPKANVEYTIDTGEDISGTRYSRYGLEGMTIRMDYTDPKDGQVCANVVRLDTYRLDSEHAQYAIKHGLEEMARHIGRKALGLK